MIEATKQFHKITTSLAVSSILLGVAGLLLFPALVFIYRPRFIYYLGYKFAWIPAGLGCLFGLIAISRSKKYKLVHGLKAARAGAILCLVVSLLSILMPSWMSLATRMLCGSHMSGLGKAITLYAENNGIYPDPNRWCDQLLETDIVKPKHFLCLPDYRIQYFDWSYSNLRPGIGKCHYAMNIYCRPDSSPDTVLLFETTLGWNKHGGPELLTLNNHDGDGCNILFKDGHVRFESHPLELNWGVTSNIGLNPDRL